MHWSGSSGMEPAHRRVMRPSSKSRIIISVAPGLPRSVMHWVHEAPEAKLLLKRILEENPHPEIRGRACLAMAFARRLQLRDETRTTGNLPQNQEERVKAKELLLQSRKSKTTDLAADIEKWLRRLLDEFPGVLLEQDIMDDVSFLAGNLGPTAGQILRRLAETHPQPETRYDAECGLVLQQMEIAAPIADLRSVADLPVITQSPLLTKQMMIMLREAVGLVADVLQVAARRTSGGSRRSARTSLARRSPPLAWPGR